METCLNQTSAGRSGQGQPTAISLDRQVGSTALSATAKPSDTSSGYAFSRVPSGSNIAVWEATVTGKHSFMYSTCNLVPATALSIGR